MNQLTKAEIQEGFVNTVTQLYKKGYISSNTVEDEVEAFEHICKTVLQKHQNKSEIHIQNELKKSQSKVGLYTYPYIRLSLADIETLLSFETIELFGMWDYRSVVVDIDCTKQEVYSMTLTRHRKY